MRAGHCLLLWPPCMHRACYRMQWAAGRSRPTLSWSSCSATSQAPSTFLRLSSLRGCPDVVLAVTVTTITVAC